MLQTKFQKLIGIFILMALLMSQTVCSDDIADFSIEWVDSSAFPLVVVYYSTQDETGEIAGPMWVPDQVRVYERDVEHRTGKFEDDQHAPAYVSVIIDSSGSMEGSLQEVLKAAKQLIKQFDNQDRAELVDFDSKVLTRRNFTGDTDSLLSSLDQIEVGGGTALFDAVATGFDHLKHLQGMKAVLVLSDGEDENSTRYDFDTLKSRLQSEGVRVFPIALGKNVDTSTLNEIAELSGGSFYQADDADDVGDIYTEIITYLHSLHRMWYSSSFGTFDGRRRTLTVKHTATGTTHEAGFQAPKSEYWSHAIHIQRDRAAAPVRIRPDGEYASMLMYKTVIDKEGRRFTRYNWEDIFDGSMTEHFICGYAHRNYGSLQRYDPQGRWVKEVEARTILEDAAGEFHRDWSWYPKGISPNEQYLVMSSDPEGGEYDYYFLLFDRENKKVLWEKGLFVGEFDEPGPVSVADTGFVGIVQEDNLFLIEADGRIRDSLMWQETGRRWQRLDMSADGRLCIGRVSTGDKVWAYSTSGDLLWEKSSDCHEKGGYVSISPNGRYFGYADFEGPHLCDREGKVLFELPAETDFGIEEWRMQNGIDIANDGSFVYSIGNRVYYRQLQR